MNVNLNRLAIITTYFNPAGYSALLDNYKIFSEDIISQNLDLWTVEIAFGNADFELKKNDRVIQIRSSDIMWHKERALNILIESLPKEYDKIAWLDADILFENRKWADEACKLLEEHPIIQCYQKAFNYTKGNQKLSDTLINLGYASQLINPVKKKKEILNPGYAWAGRRNFLKKHLLYDRHILGANDGLMLFAFFGRFNIPYLKENMNTRMQIHFLKWAKNVFKDAQGKVGYMEGTIFHLWHGEIKNRQYLSRDLHLLNNNYDPEKDIDIGKNGLFHWSSDKTSLHQDVKQYFADRDDDGILEEERKPCFLRNSVSSSSHFAA